MPMAYELYRTYRLPTRKPHNQARVRRWRKIGRISHVPEIDRAHGWRCGRGGIPGQCARATEPPFADQVLVLLVLLVLFTSPVRGEKIKYLG